MPKTLVISRSYFLLVKCKICSNQQVTFSNSAVEVRCNSCNAVLIKPTGGKGVLMDAELVKRVG